VIRLILTGVAAFAVLVFGYHEFASSSGGAQTMPPAATSSQPSSTVAASAPVKLPSKVYSRLGVDVDHVKAAIDGVTMNADLCHERWPAGVAPMSPSCDTLLRSWDHAYVAAQRDFTSATRLATGECKTALVAYFGPRSKVTRLSGLVRKALRGQGPEAEAASRSLIGLEADALTGWPAIRAIEACQPATS
jgi:hypothetical protein